MTNHLLLCIACTNCGAPLEVPAWTRHVTCTHCDSPLQVLFDGGAAKGCAEASSSSSSRCADCGRLHHPPKWHPTARYCSPCANRRSQETQRHHGKLAGARRTKQTLLRAGAILLATGVALVAALCIDVPPVVGAAVVLVFSLHVLSAFDDRGRLRFPWEWEV